jgi:hypothetical protein
LLIVLVPAVAGVVGLGFYLGWFRLPAGAPDGKANFAVTVDKAKIDRIRGRESFPDKQPP